MSIYSTTRIRCDECGYEEPNDYYDGIKTWIFIDDMETDKTLHFCNEECLEYNAQTDKKIFTNRREYKSNDANFSKLVYGLSR